MDERWPAHFAPAFDELLSSWTTRLAVSNGLMAATFARTILSSSMSIGDVDVTVPDRMATALALGTGVSGDIIRGLGFVGKSDILGGLEPASPLRPWVLPLRLAWGKRWRKALQLCPACLASFGYFRQTWRLAFVTCCPIHKICLLDQCSRCGSRIRIWQFRDKTQGPVLDLAHACYRCKQPFSALELQPAPHAAIAAQTVLIDAFELRSSIGIGILTFDAADGFAFLRNAIANRSRRRAPPIELQSLAMRRLALAPWDELIVSVDRVDA